MSTCRDAERHRRIAACRDDFVALLGAAGDGMAPARRERIEEWIGAYTRILAGCTSCAVAPPPPLMSTESIAAAVDDALDGRPLHVWDGGLAVGPAPLRRPQEG